MKTIETWFGSVAILIAALALATQRMRRLCW